MAGPNLVLGVDGATDGITVDNEFLGGGEIQRFTFSDGTVWTLSDVAQALVARQETTGDDKVTGINGLSELIDGNTGNDSLVGGTGNDTYVWNVGYGNDTISDGGGLNQVVFGAGITSANITLALSTDGNANDVAIGYAGQTLTVLGEINAGTIGRLVFADGTELTASAIAQLLDTPPAVTAGGTITGTSGSDLLYGMTVSGGNNTFDGHGGNDFEQGIGQQDIFIFNKGYGRLEINETNASARGTLKLGNTISESSVRVSASQSGQNLVLSVGTGSDEIILDNALVASSEGVQAVSFAADGTTWSKSELLAMAQAGTAGPDMITGTSGDDVIDGLGGTDYVKGNGGSDTFVFNQGYGRLEISQYDVNGATSILHFGTGITQSDISLLASPDGKSLELHVGTGTDYVVLDNELTDTNAGVAYIQFSDGTIWARKDFIAATTTGTAVTDSLVGGSADNVIDGGGGHDFVQGTGGADTYVFDPGYGHLEISDTAGGYKQGILRLGAGITASEVRVSATADGTGIVLAIGSGTDMVQIDQMLTNPSAGVEYVQFPDGSSWSRTDLLNLLATQAETAGNDTVIGHAQGQLYDGLGGADYVQGQGGGDTFFYGSGYGFLDIHEVGNSQSPTNTLQFGPGITSASLTITYDQNNNLTITDGMGKDRIRLDGMYGNTGNGVQSVHFADGTSLTAASLTAMATSSLTVVPAYGAYTYVSGGGELDVSLPSGQRGTLTFGSSISSTQITAHGDPFGNIVLEDGVAGDEVILDGMLSQSGAGPQQILFADGSSLNRSQIFNLAGTGTTGADTIYGGPNGAVFDGKGGNDYIQSSGGTDAFVYQAGYGALEINEVASNGDNVLRLGNSITTAQLSAKGDSRGNLTLSDGVNGDSIQLDGMLNSTANGVQSIQFSNGTDWTRAKSSRWRRPALQVPTGYTAVLAAIPLMVRAVTTMNRAMEVPTPSSMAPAMARSKSPR